jgi:hypothetical protein
MNMLIIINELPYGTCMDARVLAQEEVLEGAERSTMDALTRQTV